MLTRNLLVRIQAPKYRFSKSINIIGGSLHFGARVTKGMVAPMC